jgi:hypothetical protein
MATVPAIPSDGKICAPKRASLPVRQDVWMSSEQKQDTVSWKERTRVWCTVMKRQWRFLAKIWGVRTNGGPAGKQEGGPRPRDGPRIKKRPRFEFDI